MGSKNSEGEEKKKRGEEEGRGRAEEQEAGGRERRQPAGRQHQDLFAGEARMIQQRQRRYGGLAGSRRRLEHYAGMLRQCRVQLRQRCVDGQPGCCLE